DLGDQRLETVPVRGGRAREAEVRVDDDDAVCRPPERHGALPERVLALGALGVLDDLPDGRLADVEVGVALEVQGRDLLVRLGGHAFVSFSWLPSTMLASTRTKPIWSASEPRLLPVCRSGCGVI